MPNPMDADAWRLFSENRIKEWESQARGFISDLEGVVRQPLITLPAVSVSFSGANRDGKMDTAITNDKPTKTGRDFDFTEPTDPGTVPTVTDITPTESTTIPVFNEPPPEINIPPSPTFDLTGIEKPVKPPVTDIPVPDTPVDELPTLTFPDQPNLDDLPQFPGDITLGFPQFSRTAPTSDLLTPTNTFNWSEGEVNKPLLDEVRTKLTGDLRNGGYGIEAVDEDALYERARDREIQAGLEEENAVLDTFAGRGFTFPPGALAAAQAKARRATQMRLGEANRDIVINRADLFRKNREFAINQSVVTDDTVLKHEGFRLERALNAERFSAQLAIEIFNASVNRFTAQRAAFETYVAGYTAQVQGELAKLQEFDSKVRAASAKIELKQAEVQLYNTIVSAVQTFVQIHRAEVDVAVAKVSIERNKMELFRAEVQAYITEIQAHTEEFNAFEAAVRGEASKVALFGSQVDAFRTEVQAADIDSTIKNRVTATDIAKKQLELQGHSQEVETFRAKLSSEVARIEAELREYAGDTDVYTALMNAYGKLVEMTVAESTGKMQRDALVVQLQQANKELAIKHTDYQNDANIAASGLGGEMVSNIVQGMATTLNVIAQETITG